MEVKCRKGDEDGERQSVHKALGMREGGRKRQREQWNIYFLNKSIMLSL